VDQDNAYTAGTDRKTIVNLTTLAATDTTPCGSDSQGLQAAGNPDDNAANWNGGLNSSQTINGQTTTALVSSPAQGGYTDTITNPDGTQIVDTYTSGLLTQEQKLGTDQATVLWTKTWNYDGLRRLSSYVDYTGTTSYGYFEDGTQKSVTLPGHGVAQTVNTLDQPTEAPTQVTRPDSASVSQPLNGLGLASSNSGAGTIPARLGYDTAGTGAVTSLETYAGAGLGTLGTAGAGASTSWGYDQSTGQLASKTYADNNAGSDQIKYQYNAAMQLAKVIEPGITVDSFGYNGAGEQTSFSYTDSLTGVVSSSITSLDELGRLKTVSDTDNGSTFATTTAYTTQNQLFSEQYASAGNAGTQHVYYPATGFGSTGAPGALQALTVTPATGSGQPTVQTSYAYDPTSKRLNTITVNGINFAIGYLTNSDQVNTVTAGNVVTAYTPDSTDGMRLAETKTTANGTSVFDENISSNYYANDQRHTETVTRTNPGGGTESHNSTFTYNSQDELAAATDYLGGGNYSYAYDNAGNRTNLGTVNSINEYPSQTYNARGDIVNDGTNTYTWDATDRLIGETPDNPVYGSTAEQMGYDSQGRLLWEQVSTYTCNWNLSSSKEYVWDLNHIVAELDANNNNALLETYAWGPTGLLAVTTYPTDPNNPNPGTTKTYQAIEDASGSVVELLDPTVTTNNVVAAYHYDPYGNLLSSGGVAANVCPFGFQQMLSDASGKYYDNARWYDPVTGRFLSRDPAGETTTDPNPFRPFGNDPINKNDPTGLSSVEVRYHGGNQIGVYRINGTIEERLGNLVTGPEGEAWVRLSVPPLGGRYATLADVVDEGESWWTAPDWAGFYNKTFSLNPTQNGGGLNGALKAARAQEQELGIDAHPYLSMQNVNTHLQAASGMARDAVVNMATGAPLIRTGVNAARALSEAGTAARETEQVARTAEAAGAAVRTAEELRVTPGVAAASGPLTRASGAWLNAAEPAAIPAQVAEKLAGQKFNTFADLRAAVWRTIGEDAELSKGFGASSIGNMRAGNAPFAPRAFQINASDAGRRFNLHHIRAVESGGDVYDLSNIQIVSPKIHSEIHQ